MSMASGGLVMRVPLRIVGWKILVTPRGIWRRLIEKQIEPRLLVGAELDFVRGERGDGDALAHRVGDLVVDHAAIEQILQHRGHAGDRKCAAHCRLPSRRRRYSSSDIGGFAAALVLRAGTGVMLISSTLLDMDVGAGRAAEREFVNVARRDRDLSLPSQCDAQPPHRDRSRHQLVRGVQAQFRASGRTPTVASARAGSRRRRKRPASLRFRGNRGGVVDAGSNANVLAAAPARLQARA